MPVTEAHQSPSEPPVDFGLRSALTRNASLNLFGHGLPLLFAGVSIPYLLGGLGSERFGILAMAWVVLGFLGVLDMGLGKAATKYLAEAEYQEPSRRVAVARTVMLVQAGLGTLFGGALFLGAPVLVESLLKIPLELHGEATQSFRMLALAIPFTLMANSLRALLEGVQRFDLVALGRVPFSGAIFLLPLLGVWLGYDLPGVIALLVLGRAAAVVSFAYLSRGVWRGASFVASFGGWLSRSELARLIAFGKWAMLSSLVIPLFVYADRALIGAFRGMGDLTLYTAPYELMSRILVIPAAVAGSLFPAFSTLSGQDMRSETTLFIQRATKYVALATSPVIAVLYLYAPEVLGLWLGPEFAAQSTVAFRLLAIAVLLNGIGFVPAALIEGSGRPDIIGKYHVIELPLYVTLAALLTWRWGIEGAAAAWALRMVWTIPLFFYLCTRVAGLSISAVLGSRAGLSLLEGAVLMGGTVALSALALGPLAKAGLAVMLISSHMGLAWTTFLSPAERAAIWKLPRTFIAAPR